MATNIPIGVAPRAGLSRVTLVMFDERLYHGNGSVNRWMIKLTAQMHAAMVEHAPKRTGELAASIDSEVRHIGTKRISGVVGPTARHAQYVIKGTGFPTPGHYTGEIYTTRGFAERGKRGYEVLWKPVAPKDREWAGQRRKKTAVRKRGHWLRIPPDLEFEGFFAHSVPGQDPNNFMLAAYRQTRRRHRSLPLPPPGVLKPYG